MEQCARESIAVGKQLSFHVSFVVASFLNTQYVMQIPPVTSSKL